MLICDISGFYADDSSHLLGCDSE